MKNYLAALTLILTIPNAAMAKTINFSKHSVGKSGISVKKIGYSKKVGYSEKVGYSKKIGYSGKKVFSKMQRWHYDEQSSRNLRLASAGPSTTMRLHLPRAWQRALFRSVLGMMPRAQGEGEDQPAPREGALIMTSGRFLVAEAEPARVHEVDGGSEFINVRHPVWQHVGNTIGAGHEGPPDTDPPPNPDWTGSGASGGNSITERK